jgi:uncharacterized membrane protein
MFRDKLSIIGLGLAATGVAHFIAPNLFEPITKPVFPNDTSTWIMRNGATETALGAAIALPATRKLGLAGLGAYGAWLGSRAAMTARG